MKFRRFGGAAATARRYGRSMVRWIAALAAGFALTACSPKPPPEWATGGAPLAIGPATWTAADGTTFEVSPSGAVFADGHALFTVDRAGRVYDTDNDPVAILLPDGTVAGTEDSNLGRVGVTNASPPGSDTAWLSVSPNGQVVYYESDGARNNGGVWRGCVGPMLRTCTFVTHLITLRNATSSPTPGVMFGVGIGVGI